MDEQSKLSFPVILLITINSIMGTGIFFLPAVGAREAGLFAIFSWVIMGFIAIYYSMIFGELVSRYPKEGGVYEYAKEAFGFFPSFLLGWMTLIAANITIAMLMVGAIKYVGPHLNNFFISILSIIFILIFNSVAFKGLKTGKVMLVTFAMITLTSVLGIAIPGILRFNPSNFLDWTAHPSFAALNPGFSGMMGGFFIIIATIFFIAETFFGWETSTFLAEQVRNPKKVMPKAFIWGTIVIAIVSILFVIASKSVIHWSILGYSKAPLADLAGAIYGVRIIPFYSIMVYLAIIGSVAGWIVAAPNLIVALAKDKLFIHSFAKLHPKTQTPYKAIIFQTIVTSFLVIVGAGNYETLLHLLVPMLLVLYSSVIISLIVIRRKKPLFDGYKAPGGTKGPYILIILTASLILMWLIKEDDALKTLQILISFVIIGIPVFLMMNFFHNPHASLHFQNKTVELVKLFERFFLPKKIRKRILQGIEKHHKILFLGAGSGLIINEANINKEHVTIIEHSKTLANHLQKRFPEIKIIHDEHLISRIHPDAEVSEIIISLGLLSNIQDLRTYLKYLNDVMPENAVIKFFDYSRFYKIIPNNIPDFKELEQIFKENGFVIRVVEIKGFLWDYLIVEGIKTKEDTRYI